MFKFGTDPALSWRPAVLKEFISDTLHAQLRNKAQETLATQPSAEIRALIHREAPIAGRAYTALAFESSQRAKVQRAVQTMTNEDLRSAAGNQLPTVVKDLLRWLDN